MFCLKEPDSFCGGETVLLKNRDLTAILDPEVIRKFEEKKVCYQAFLPNKTTNAGLQKSWQDRFWLEDPQVCKNWFCYVKTSSQKYRLTKNIAFYYIKISEIPSELLPESFIYSHVKITCFIFFQAVTVTNSAI